ncbi:MAG: hypothetical protein ABEI39_05600 [Halobacteriales archaeon]
MTTDDLERRVADLEAAVERWAQESSAGATSDGHGVSRRSFLQGLGVAGVGSHAVGAASADPQGQLGTSSDPVKTVYAQGLAGGLTGGSRVTSLLGTGLSVDSGELTADTSGEANTASNVGTGAGAFKQKTGSDLEFRSLVGGTNLTVTEGTDELTLDASATYPSVSDGGSTVLSGASDIDFASNLSVTDDADGTVTVDASTSGEANTASNVGTGAELFKQKSGSDLEFRTLLTEGALSTTQNADTVSLGGPWADGDADGLLEPRSGTGYTGIDLSGVSGA